MNYNEKIAHLMNLQPRQVASTIELLDAGNTIPFIARYRKEMTVSLDEEQIREIDETVSRLRSLDERRDTIIRSIEEQGKLTPELHQQIDSAETMLELEDLYLPHKPKRRTRASIARDKGLEGLADTILQQPTSPKSAEQYAAGYLNDEVESVEDALSGARDIVAEIINDHAAVRGLVRAKAQQWGSLISEKTKGADDEKGVFQTYYEFNGRVSYLRPHQILAMNRGESEKVLRVKVDIPERDWMDAITTHFRPNPWSPLGEQLAMAILDCAKRLLLPAIERDIRRSLTERAETHAIQVFAKNLRNLLNQPPLLGHIVMGIDPAYRTGCKVVVIDHTGKVLATTAIYPHPPQRQHRQSLESLSNLINRFHITLIAIGNGTASRETEALVAELTRNMDGVHYLIVNEAGASVYSASKEARAELPDLDVTLRGAVSIARRVQDPLAELVKIDPKSIGVGLYQHDVNQKQLSETLDTVVESVVNRVGVDLNTASPALLQHVAGIGAKLAENIVSHRDTNGPFKNRNQLKKISGLGAKAFEQAAGFLRVRNGNNPLDASAIHPESYKIATGVLVRSGLDDRSTPEERADAVKALRGQIAMDLLAAELKTGIPTLEDIFEQLIRPGRDPREDLPTPILRSDVLSMDDLSRGMILDGTVRNVVDFGAFVDIGVKQDGLLHISKVPREVSLGVGDIIQVEILNVDQERGRISLGWVEDY